VGGGTTLFLAGVAVAGIAYRAVPRWLAWTGVVLAVAPFLPSPLGYFGSLVFLLWVAAAGVALAVRDGAFRSPSRSPWPDAARSRTVAPGSPRSGGPRHA
jgi:hypothetical protein